MPAQLVSDTLGGFLLQLSIFLLPSTSPLAISVSRDRGSHPHRQVMFALRAIHTRLPPKLLLIWFDGDAIRAYLNTVPAVGNPVVVNTLPFPFNILALSSHGVTHSTLRRATT